MQGPARSYNGAIDTENPVVSIQDTVRYDDRKVAYRLQEPSGPHCSLKAVAHVMMGMYFTITSCLLLLPGFSANSSVAGCTKVLLGALAQFLSPCRARVLHIL